MMPANASSGERLPSIDAFRGLAVLLMGAANYLAGVGWIPALLKHAPDVGYTVVDVVAPMFLMAVGFTAGLSARRRREKQGAAAALGGMSVRYLAILGIGAVITAGQAICLPGDTQPNWGVLQAIGSAGLLTLLVIFAPAWVRAAAGIILLAGYQWMLGSTDILSTVLASSHNGIIGAISWAGMLMLATAAADVFFAAATPAKRSLRLFVSGASSLGIGLVLSLWLPISKNRASMPYMLVSLGICLIVFLLFHLLLDGRKPRLTLLRAAGKNPLMMYIVQLLILGVFTLPQSAAWYSDAPAWLVACQCAALLGAMLTLARWMEINNFILKI